MKKILSVLTAFLALAAMFVTFAACSMIEESETQLETSTIDSQVYTDSEETSSAPETSDSEEEFRPIQNGGNYSVGEGY